MKKALTVLEEGVSAVPKTPDAAFCGAAVSELNKRGGMLSEFPAHFIGAFRHQLSHKHDLSLCLFPEFRIGVLNRLSDYLFCFRQIVQKISLQHGSMPGTEGEDAAADVLVFIAGVIEIFLRQIPEGLSGSHEEARSIQLIQTIGDERFLGIFRRIPEVADLQHGGGCFGGADTEALMRGFFRKKHKTAVCHYRFKTEFIIRKIGVNKGKEGIVFLKALFAGGAVRFAGNPWDELPHHGICNHVLKMLAVIFLFVCCGKLQFFHMISLV